MLVDTASQYGVGSIYFLAGWFELVPIGYGTLGLLDGVLTALFFAAGYARRCGSPAYRGRWRPPRWRWGWCVLVFNREYPVGALPQEGPLRFGLPMVLVLARRRRVRAGGRRRARPRAGARRGRASRRSGRSRRSPTPWPPSPRSAACESWLARRRRGCAWLVRAGRPRLALACLAAHLLFAAATLAARGPAARVGPVPVADRAFLVGDLGDVTYDFSRWSPGLGGGRGVPGRRHGDRRPRAPAGRTSGAARTGGAARAGRPDRLRRRVLQLLRRPVRRPRAALREPSRRCCRRCG